ncbi:MAG: hypothetical protein ABIV07_04390 [Polaromonas sp.]
MAEVDNIGNPVLTGLPSRFQVLRRSSKMVVFPEIFNCSNALASFTPSIAESRFIGGGFFRG